LNKLAKSVDCSVPWLLSYSNKVLAIAVIAALSVRVGWSLARGQEQPFYDSDSYVRIADNLLEGRGFLWGDQRAGRPPIYPLLVAATRAPLAGREFLLLYLVQAALGTGAVLLFSLAAGRLFGPAARGLTAAALAVHPFLVYYTALVLSEVLFVFLVAGLFYLLVVALERGGLAAAVGAGVFAGLAFLTRPSVLGLVLVFALWLAFSSLRLRRRGAEGNAAAAPTAFSGDRGAAAQGEGAVKGGAGAAAGGEEGAGVGGDGLAAEEQGSTTDEGSPARATSGLPFERAGREAGAAPDERVASSAEDSDAQNGAREPEDAAPLLRGGSARATSVAPPQRAARATSPGTFRRGLAQAALLLGVVAAAALPWAIRNRALTGHWVVTTTGVGASLYDGLGPQADGSSNMEFLNSMDELEEMGEVERDAHLRQKALEAAWESPGRVLRLALVKAWRFWSPVPNASRFRRPLYVAVSLLAVVPVYLLALRAVLRGTAGARRLLLLLSGPLYFTLLHMVFVGSTRYRLPVMPFAVIIAAEGALSLLSLPRQKSEGTGASGA